MHATVLPRVLAAALAAGACGGGGDELSCPDLPMGSVTLELGGSGEEGATFAPFDDGSERPLIFGTQGGFHVWLWVRARGLCPGSAAFTLRASDEETGQEVLLQEHRLVLDPVGSEEGSSTVRSALPLILCPNSVGQSVPDRPLNVVVEVEDADGRIGTAETSFVPVCDPSVQGGSFIDQCLCLCGMEGCT